MRIVNIGKRIRIFIYLDRKDWSFCYDDRLDLATYLCLGPLEIAWLK